MNITHDYDHRIDYDLWSNVSYFPKVEEININKEYIEKRKAFIDKYMKPSPSIYYPIVAEAWKRFKET